MATQVRPPTVGPSLAADLVAAMLEAGLPAGAALDVLRSCLRDLDLAEPPELTEVTAALALAQRSGLAPAGLVRAAAAQRRRARTAARTVAAQRLSVLVVLPMGLCLLPAFLLLTVAPFVLALLRG